MTRIYRNPEVLWREEDEAAAEAYLGLAAFTLLLRRLRRALPGSICVSPRATSVASFFTTIPALLNPMRAINRPIPTGDDPNSLLAVFWDVLMPGSGMAYRYSNNRDTCIVSWNHFQR